MRIERVEPSIDRPTGGHVGIDGKLAAFHEVPFKRRPVDRVYFKGRKLPFDIDERFCRCRSCGELAMELRFHEAGRPSKGVAPLEFHIYLSMKDFTEDMTHGHWDEMPRAAVPLAKEFIEKVPNALKERSTRRLPIILRVERSIDDGCDKYEEEDLDTDLAYADIFEEDPKVMAGETFGFRFEHEGETYFVDDNYLLSGKEDIFHVGLDFFRFVEGTLGTAFLVRVSDAFVSFAGVAAVHPEPPLDEDGALELLRAFLSHKEDMGTVFMDRLDQIVTFKDAVLERIQCGGSEDGPWSEEEDLLDEDDLPGGPEEIPRPGVHKAKVGRNDPCPCGSGKKYKKCCGGPWAKDNDLDLDP